MFHQGALPFAKHFIHGETHDKSSAIDSLVFKRFYGAIQRHSRRLYLATISVMYFEATRKSFTSKRRLSFERGPIERDQASRSDMNCTAVTAPWAIVVHERKNTSCVESGNVIRSQSQLDRCVLFLLFDGN